MVRVAVLLFLVLLEFLMLVLLLTLLVVVLLVLLVLLILGANVRMIVQRLTRKPEDASHA
jgi:hypothetical protein